MNSHLAFALGIIAPDRYPMVEPVPITLGADPADHAEAERLELIDATEAAGAAGCVIADCAHALEGARQAARVAEYHAHCMTAARLIREGMFGQALNTLERAMTI